MTSTKKPSRMSDIAKPRIRHIIGQFRDDSSYPKDEDFEYLILKWYHIEGGYDFIHNYRGLKDEGMVVFDNKILLELLNNDQEVYDKLVERLIQEKKISLIKETAHTQYYQVNSLKHYFN